MSVIRAFTLDQAASIAKVSKRRAASWARHGIVVPSVVYDVDRVPHHYLYDFVDLVGLRTLGMLREHGDLEDLLGYRVEMITQPSIRNPSFKQAVDAQKVTGYDAPDREAAA